MPISKSESISSYYIPDALSKYLPYRIGRGVLDRGVCVDSGRLLGLGSTGSTIVLVISLGSFFYFVKVIARY